MARPHDAVFFTAGALTVPEAAENNALLANMLDMIMHEIHAETGANVRIMHGKRPQDIEDGHSSAWYFSPDNPLVNDFRGPIAVISGETWDRLTANDKMPVARAEGTHLILESADEPRFAVTLPQDKCVFIAAGSPKQRGLIVRTLTTLVENANLSPCVTFAPMHAWEDSFKRVLQCVLNVALTLRLYNEKIVVVSKEATTAGVCVCDGVSALLEIIKLDAPEASSDEAFHLKTGHGAAQILFTEDAAEQEAFQTRIGLKLSNMIHENRREI
jgi:hypothetical protein